MTRLSMRVPALGLVALTGIGTWFAVMAPSTVGNTDIVSHPEEVIVEPGQVELVCAPDIVDSARITETNQVAELGKSDGVWGLTELTPLSGGGQVSVLGESDHGATGTSVAAQFSGDLASFMVETCQVTSRSHAFAVGSTELGEDAVLVLSNPADIPVTVNLQIFDLGGVQLESPVTLVVPGLSTVAVLPGTYAQGLAAPILVVDAEGAGVAAWLQTSGLDGEVALGVARTQGSSPSYTAVLPGIQGSAKSTLRVGNLGADPATLNITVMSREGSVTLEGATNVNVAPRSSVQVSLDGLQRGDSAVIVEADQEIVAAITETYDGAEHTQVRDANYQSRTVIGNALAITEANLVTVAGLNEVATRLGFEDVSVALSIANTTEDTATLDIQGQTKTLAAGAGQTYMLLPESPRNRFTSDVPVHVAYVVAVSTSVGELRSVAALGVEGVLAQTRLVSLEPR